MPPHVVLGFTVGEWASIVTIAGSLISAIVILISALVIKPLTRSMNGLRDGLNEFKKSSDADHRYYSKTLRNHEVRISVLEEDKKNEYH